MRGLSWSGLSGPDARLPGMVAAALIDEMRARLADAGNPEKAGPMQAYLKSTMPTRGVYLAQVRKISAALAVEHPLDDRAVWEATVRELFDEAAYREERYAAIALTGHRNYRQWQDPAALALYEHLIVTGAWWDLVDEVAIRRVGPILRAHPGAVGPVLRTWAADENMWRRRSAIIAQVTAKSATDSELLEACIEPSLASKEFFLRKGIGWALRDYAKTDPDWVRDYVARHEGQLSALSKREATR